MSAVDALGLPVGSPPYVDPAIWARFSSKVVCVPGGCALWLAPPRDDGYGQFWAPSTVIEATAGTPALLSIPHLATARPRDRIWRAHRLAFQAWRGPLDDPDDEVMHVCDEPLCVPVTEDRLEHFVIGSTQANTADRARKDRTAHRGRHGLMWWGAADRRGQYLRSLALHEALFAAVKTGINRSELPGLVAAVNALGDMPQLELF